MTPDISKAFTREDAERFCRIYWEDRGCSVKSSSDWNLWEYGPRPFWSARQLVRGPAWLDLNLYGIHVHENGEVSVVTQEDGLKYMKEAN